MRDIALALGILCYLPICLRFPAAGVICWSWVSLMNPHLQVYGFMGGKPINLVVAIATILGWLANSEPKKWPSDAFGWCLFVFVVWFTLASAFAPFPDIAWDYWDRFVRTLAVVFLALFMMKSKSRIHAVILGIVLSLGYYGAKGGVFTILTAGSARVLGPIGTELGDNNQLAAAMVMSIPMVNYLQMQSKFRLVRIGFMVGMALMIIMVFGSNSRGGMVALSASLLVLLLRSRRRLSYAIVAALVLLPTLAMMPQSFWDRMHTLNNVEADGSFMGRVMAWRVALDVAIDYFPFGAGFYTPQLPVIFNHYFPGETIHAAHSIYFQVLGEHGFIGLAIYLTILIAAWRNTQRVRRLTRNRPELLWAYDLASMLQVSMVGFCVGGAALSMAYFDGFFLLLAMSSCLREWVRRQVFDVPSTTVRHVSAAGSVKPPIGASGNLLAHRVRT